jgi:hypothetical protein
MTFDDNLADERLSAPQPPVQRGDGVNPVSERGVDHERDEFMRELEDQPSRPLTSDENGAAALDSGNAFSAYAPASEPVPVEPLPGDRDIVDHLDTLTSERTAAATETESVPAPIAVASTDRPSPDGQASSTRSSLR